MGATTADAARSAARLRRARSLAAAFCAGVRAARGARGGLMYAPVNIALHASFARTCLIAAFLCLRAVPRAISFVDIHLRFYFAMAIMVKETQ